MKPMIWGEDSPRARVTDPIVSHEAADLSAVNRRRIRNAVWAIVHLYGPVTGNQVNEIYMKRRQVQGWPECHFDSPRKRLHELAAEDVIDVVDRVGRERAFDLHVEGDAA